MIYKQDTKFDFEVEATPGIVVLNSVFISIDRPNSKLISIDCSTKRPEILSYGFLDSGEITVMLDANEHSLHLDPVLINPTIIRIIFTDEPEADYTNWYFFVEGTKWGCEIILMQREFDELSELEYNRRYFDFEDL